MRLIEVNSGASCCSLSKQLATSWGALAFDLEQLNSIKTSTSGVFNLNRKSFALMMKFGRICGVRDHPLCSRLASAWSGGDLRPRCKSWGKLWNWPVAVWIEMSLMLATINHCLRWQMMIVKGVLKFATRSKVKGWPSLLGNGLTTLSSFEKKSPVFKTPPHAISAVRRTNFDK